MQISFVTLTENVEFTQYELSQQIETEIRDCMDLDQNKEFIICFSRFVDFNKEYHGKAFEYFLNTMSENLERHVVGEDTLNYQVTYSFKNADDVMNQLNVEQLKFLCAVFHHLNLKKYLVACCVLLIKDIIKFEDLKEFCKSDTFKIAIFVAPDNQNQDKQQ